MNTAQNNIHRIIGEEREWYPLRRQHSVPHLLKEILTTRAQGHPALTSAVEPILAVTMPGVPETFKSIIDEMTYGSDFKLINLLHMENANLTHKDLNTSNDEPENRWNIHLVSYDTLTSRAKPSSYSQLSSCACSFGIWDESHRYKTKNGVGWQIAIKAKIRFKLEVTATPGFQSLNDLWYQTMWLFPGTPEDPEDETLMERHGAEALYCTVKSLMHPIRTDEEVAQQAAAHRTIQIASPWTIRRWTESKLAN